MSDEPCLPHRPPRFYLETHVSEVESFLSRGAIFLRATLAVGNCVTRTQQLHDEELLRHDCCRMRTIPYFPCTHDFLNHFAKVTFTHERALRSIASHLHCTHSRCIWLVFYTLRASTFAEHLAQPPLALIAAATVPARTLDRTYLRRPLAL